MNTNKDTVEVHLHWSAHTFKFSAAYPNRVYFFQGDWNRDMYELPAGRWRIQSKTLKYPFLVVVFIREPEKKSFVLLSQPNPASK